jgi:succinate dehydrogenase/fumarate reductase cytochrome b subunit
MTETKPTSTRRWARLQAISGLAFASFAILHLVNLAISALGPGAYDRFQDAARSFYHVPVVELGLLFALALHVAAAIARIRGRGGLHLRARLPLRTRLQRLSGLFLALSMLGHVAATRGLDLVFGVAPRFAGLSFTFEWMPAFFVPYYTLLMMCGVYHTAHGVTMALRVLGVGMPGRVPHWLFGGVVAVGWVAGLVGLASIAGLLYPIDDPLQNDYAQFFLQRVGVGR